MITKTPVRRPISRGLFLLIALACMPSAFGGLFDSKSEFEELPALPPSVTGNPAFAAPAPLVTWIERSASDGPPEISEHASIRPHGGASIMVSSALRHTRPKLLTVTGPDTEVKDYRQTIRLLGGMYEYFFQKREAASADRQVAFHYLRFSVSEITDVSGKLFPLEVGNSLKFTNVWRSNDNAPKMNPVEYRVLSVEPAVKRYPQLNGRIWVVQGIYDGKQPGCEFLWSEQFQYEVSRSCGNPRKHEEMISFEQPPEGLALAARLKREDAERAAAERAEVERRHAEEVAASKERSRMLSPEARGRARMLFGQAFELFQQGEFAAAVVRFNDGLKIDPANGLACYYLAETLARQKRDSEAQRHYRCTIDFTPDSKEAALAQTRMKR